MRLKIKLTSIFLVFVFEGLFGSDFEDSELALHHFMQGEFLMNQGNYSLAILEFQDAIDLDPNASTIHVSIADAYLKLGKVKRSKSHLEIAIDLNPEEYEALEILGEIYIKSKDYKNAQIIFKNLHDLNPLELDYIFALADLARIQKDWDLAIEYYIEGYNTDNIAINGLEQALQISIAINNFIKAEKVCELLLIEQPENIKIVNSSTNSMYVEKCFFQGKEYKLIGRFKENIWSIISQKPVKVNSEVFFDYSKQDLIFFDKNCSSFFTS